MSALPVAVGQVDAAPDAAAGLALSDGERQWLAEHPVVRVGTDFLAPVAFFEDEAGPLQGVAADYLTAAAAMLGVEFDLVRRTHRDHPRIMAALGEHEIDLVAAAMAGHAEVRDGVAVETRPYLEVPVVAVTPEAAPRIGGIRALDGLRVAGTPPVIEAMRRQGVEAEAEVAAPHVGLLGVATGRWDVYVGDLPVISHFLAEQAITNVRINGELPPPNRMVMLVRAADAPLATALDKAFAAIAPAERDRIWQRWFRVPYAQSLMASPWLWAGIGAGAVALGPALLLTCQLRRRVRQVQGTVESLDHHLMSAHLDCNATILEVTNALCRATGFEGAELVGRSLAEVGAPHGAGGPPALRALMDDVRRGQAWRGIFKVERKDGGSLMAEAVVSPRRRKDETVGFTVIWQDISDSLHYRDLSLRDELTGLYNRRHYNAEAPALLAATRRDGGCFALVAVDVDCFKAYNDTYGHAAGDAVLTAVGQVLRETMRRERDLAFRLGGEEFAVVFAAGDEAEARQRAETLRLALEARGIPHSGGPAGVVTASVGVAVAGPGDERDLAALWQAADAALYRAKHGGRNRVAMAA
ncbi:MAG: diguanylate cyclase [Alphaproteobacteria bacterium]